MTSLLHPSIGFTNMNYVKFLPGFCVYAKASADLNDDTGIRKPGHCGIFLAWRTQLSPVVKKIKTESDRVCAIQLVGLGNRHCNLCIIGVYLPQQGCKIANYSDHLAEVESLIERNNAECEIVVIGDFNCHLGPEVGNRFWGKTSLHGISVVGMADRLGLRILDSDYSTCTGPNYSFYVDGVGCSYIDHCLISKSLLSKVNGCAVLEETLENLSDHLPIYVSLNVDKMPG
jgi:hypothetical protein